MGSLIYYGALFLAKVLDNALSTTKTINKEVIDSINTAHKLSTLEALLRKVISEELRNISLHIPFEPDTDSASDENESSIMDFLESF